MENAKKITRSRIKRITIKPNIDTFDITTSKNHNFFANGLLVHNSEIILRDRQFCNLSEVIVRPHDTFASLQKKVRVAAILGTFQSTLTNFKYLTAKWKQNCDEERLLGVSLTGVMDNHLLNNVSTTSAKHLEELKDIAIATNAEWAKKLKISPATAVTCNKPSGTVSQLTDSASGIHPRHADYYIRTVRLDKSDPLMSLMETQGFPHEDDVTNPSRVAVFSFPMKAPKGSVTRTQRNAIEQLELWKLYQDNYCEHKPSVTVSIKELEWLDVGAWTYRNFEKMSGVSFLPFSEHTYKQAPYQDCTEEEYNQFLTKMPAHIDWTKLAELEVGDQTTEARAPQCTSGTCEL